jgi:hypothetical protein
MVEVKDLQEQREYVSRVITEKRPICWWCRRRPDKKTRAKCEAGLDWLDVVGMGRRACAQFALDMARIGAREKEEAHAKPEQLEINFE